MTEAQRMASVKVAWASEGMHLLPSHHKIYAELYDCGMMGSNCGLCSLIEKDYGCNYGNDVCSYTGLTTPQTANTFCSNPIIERFSPPGAPLNSINTTLIIHGHNLAFSPDGLKVMVLGRPCEVTERTKKLFLPTQTIACELAPSSEQKQGQIGYGTKYPAWSAHNFIYQNAEVKQLHPMRGPRSGSTLVTIVGTNLDFGSMAEVEVDGKKAAVVRRNNTSITILTPPSDNNTNIFHNIKMGIDGVEILTDKLRFNYVEDPSVTNVDPLFSLKSGGNQVDFRGDHLNTVQRPQVIFYLPHTNVTSKCKVEHHTYLRCEAPDLRKHNIHLPASLHYGLVMDGVTSLLRLSSRKDFKPIQYHPTPTIASLPQPIKYHKVHNNKLVIEGHDLAVLKEFTDFMINISDASCNKKTYNDTHIVCELPEPEKVNFTDSSMEADIMVSLGNYRRLVGVVSYHKRPYLLYLMIACVVSVAILLVIILTMCVLCVLKKKRKRKEYSNSFLLKPSQKSNNNNTSTPSSTTLQQQHEEKQLIPTIPDDEWLLEAIMDRMEGHRLKSVARNIFVPRDHILLEEMIGQGTFTKVHIATVTSHKINNSNKPLCVKSLIDNTASSPRWMDSMIRDSAIMNNFKHLNVLTLVAFSIGPHKQPWLVLPYMRNGDLKSHVKDKSKTFTARELLTLAQKVAGGMAYLANLNFVHRDLCSSNCLLDEQLEVKISDFGLSTELQQRIYHDNNNEKYDKLAIKWMSIESLENFVFTSKSDVWSYGVLLWELMTRGVTPYPDILPTHLPSFLRSGRRLKKPKYCPNNVFLMMGECWNEVPERRPTFTDLVNRLELLLNPPKKRGAEEEPLYINHHPLPPPHSPPSFHSPTNHTPTNHSPTPTPPPRIRI